MVRLDESEHPGFHQSGRDLIESRFWHLKDVDVDPVDDPFQACSCLGQSRVYIGAIRSQSRLGEQPAGDMVAGLDSRSDFRSLK